jgi:hypothetical protein
VVIGLGLSVETIRKLRGQFDEQGVESKSTIGRIWSESGLRPHLTDGFKLSADPHL